MIHCEYSNSSTAHELLLFSPIERHTSENLFQGQIGAVRPRQNCLGNLRGKIGALQDALNVAFCEPRALGKLTDCSDLTSHDSFIPVPSTCYRLYERRYTRFVKACPIVWRYHSKLSPPVKNLEVADNSQNAKSLRH